MPLAGLRQSQRRGKKEKVGGGGTVRKMRGRRVLTNKGKESKRGNVYGENGGEQGAW